MFFDFTPENNKDVKDIYGPGTADIHALTYDSRIVHRQTAFFCINGDHYDGHQFIDQAAGSGANVIIGTEREILYQSHLNHPAITYVIVEDAKRMMSILSAEFYAHVYQRMKSIAVTGTNGKTTVTAFIHQLLNRSGMRTGSIGTEKVRDDQSSRSLNHTTTPPPKPRISITFSTPFMRKALRP
ncbi:Mur ligase domain-containing protein [Salisediminibacterium beveridgei]|uniref:UDP-N-acetylmuramoyl-L-alanyl-D-glutamate--2, 6-diaminopimelate ligase 1 n=1 Tax=Salisediminibacterium beveridgei TaxID=632773 RepID=A0A1D7QZT1_9BACI|nr:Mur ligase domain-containing protein [Salisediminibacterium beveridgei]AOM84524.1 UDP-N-acetylmuramoyl-L-alanyl-D-glutamate--2,6-diaminopimelate ligase 1 [Salisediminibacterium beveridgei]